MLFETHPHTECVSIVDAYRGLVGLSITRGFTHKVRELFGGPRGCTHTTALLMAMAPVAVQCIWSMNVVELPSRRTADAARRRPAAGGARAQLGGEPEQLPRVG